MDIYAHSGEGKRYDPGVEVCKEGDYTNSIIFYMYVGGKYMRLPIFWEIPKMYNPMGILSWDPMASI